MIVTFGGQKEVNGKLEIDAVSEEEAQHLFSDWMKSRGIQKNNKRYTSVFKLNMALQLRQGQHP